MPLNKKMYVDSFLRYFSDAPFIIAHVGFKEICTIHI